MFNQNDLGSLILGLAVLMSNIGARYIFIDFTEKDIKRQKILAHPLMRYAYIFAIGFVGTRSFRLAGIVTAIYTVFMYLTAENT